MSSSNCEQKFLDLIDASKMLGNLELTFEKYVLIYGDHPQQEELAKLESMKDDLTRKKYNFIKTCIK